MPGYRFVAARLRASSAWLGAAWLLTVGCKEAPRADAREPNAIRRGDRVVVEAKAAEFFEGRVLSVHPGKLRVESAPGDDPVSVAVADAYPLPAPAVDAVRDQLLVCRVGSAWVGCRVESAAGNALAVRTASGEQSKLTRTDAFAPSPLTQLNLKRQFERAEERARFRAAARRAGEPTPPVGYRLLPRARVVARRNGSWFSGAVHELDDGGAYVAFESDGIRQRVSATDIVPEPPYPSVPARGDFALLRPVSPSEPWTAVRIVAPLAADLKIATESGDERVVPQRDLLPLARAP